MLRTLEVQVPLHTLRRLHMQDRSVTLAAAGLKASNLLLNSTLVVGCLREPGRPVP